MRHAASIRERAAFAPTTFIEALDRHVEATPDRNAITAVRRVGVASEVIPLSYRSLAARARAAAEQLVAHDVRAGDRVCLCLRRPEQFCAYFVGAQLLGAIPVPLPPLLAHQTPEVFCERISSVAADCAPRATIIDSPQALSYVTRFGAGHGIEAGGLEVELSAPEGVGLTSPVEGGDAAFLQYTSGSTGDPKGVVVTHSNLLANLDAIISGAEFTPDDRGVSWLPLFHDMGLIGGVLLGLYLGSQTTVMEPEHFMLRPVAWLEAITEHRATFTVAPNFAYSLVARRIPDSALTGIDLRSLRLAFDGAEPVDEATVEAFIGRFEPYGFQRGAFFPVYGLAECTLAVAFPKPGAGAAFRGVDREQLASRGMASGDEDSSLRHVSVGAAVPGHTLRIVDPTTRAECPAGQLGEVLVAGPSVTPGYWGRPERAEAELATGDLGYLLDGRLHVVDRLDDLIIVGGRNFSPADVERAVAAVDGVTLGAVAAFGVPESEGTEALVVVATIHPASWRPTSQLRSDIRSAVAKRYGLSPLDIVLVAPGTIAKTSSGKVRRKAVKEAYLSRRIGEVDGLSGRARIKAKRLRRDIAGVIALRRTKGI